jgi:excinuclease UvrABC helicase subunit UvrB
MEKSRSSQIVEQIIRPLPDFLLTQSEVRKTEGQIDDPVSDLTRERHKTNEKLLVTPYQKWQKSSRN